MLLAKLLAAFAKIPGPVRELVVALVAAIANSPDPKRAAEEALRVRAFDEAMRRHP